MGTYSDYTTVLNKAKAALSKVGRSYTFSNSPSQGGMMYPVALTEIMNAIDYASGGMTSGTSSPGCSSNHSYTTCPSNYSAYYDGNKTAVQWSDYVHISYGNG